MMFELIIIGNMGWFIIFACYKATKLASELGAVQNLYGQSREALDKSAWECSALRKEIADLKKRLTPIDGPHRTTPILLHPKIRGFNPVTLWCEKCQLTAHVTRVGHRVHMAHDPQDFWSRWFTTEYTSRNSAHPDEEDDEALRDPNQRT